MISPIWGKLDASNHDAFIFLDPPYLFSDNSAYEAQKKDTDMTQIIVDILEFMKIA